MALNASPRRAVAAEMSRDLHVHILCGAHTVQTLARVTGLSTATVARTIAGLRRQLAREGAILVSVKEGRVWHYEIREKEGAGEQPDPLVQSIGFIKGVRRPAGESVDDALYERPGPGR